MLMLLDRHECIWARHDLWFFVTCFFSFC